MRLSNTFNAARCLPAEAGSHILTLGHTLTLGAPAIGDPGSQNRNKTSSVLSERLEWFDSSTGDHLHICLRQPVTDGFVASWPGLR